MQGEAWQDAQAQPSHMHTYARPHAHTCVRTHAGRPGNTLCIFSPKCPDHEVRTSCRHLASTCAFAEMGQIGASHQTPRYLPRYSLPSHCLQLGASHRMTSYLLGASHRMTSYLSRSRSSLLLGARRLLSPPPLLRASHPPLWVRPVEALRLLLASVGTS